MPRPAKTFEERVDSSGGPDACWPWTGGHDVQGYGVLVIRGHGHKAHRVAWEKVHGRIPAGHYICHHCDNPPCVNPAHLFAGTASDNTLDMFEKERGAPRGKGVRRRAPEESRDVMLRLAQAELDEIDGYIARHSKRLRGAGFTTSRNAMLMAWIRAGLRAAVAAEPQAANDEERAA